MAFGKNMGGVQVTPYQQQGTVANKLETCFYLGLERVKAKTYNLAIHNKKYETEEQEDGSEKIVAVTLPSDPTLWGRLNYFVGERAIEMPPLGEAFTIPGHLYRALKAKVGSDILQAQEGGDVMAKHLKEQIDRGVGLFDLTMASIGVEDATASVTALSDDELEQELARRKKMAGKTVVIQAEDLMEVEETPTKTGKKGRLAALKEENKS